jgi:excisionase family DNA binding protein
MQNPFEILQNQIVELNCKIDILLSKPEEDTSTKMYTLNEAAKIFRVDRQTVRNHIDRGNISATFIGSRILIPYQEIFNSLNEVKSLKYKR